MLEPTERAALESGLRTVWIIWAALFSTQPILVFIGAGFGTDLRVGMTADFPIGLLENALFAVSVVMLLLAYFLRRGIVSFGPAGGATQQPQRSGQPPFPG